MRREFVLRREVALDATPEQVWEAIATGPGLAAWFMPMELDPADDSVTAWEPGERLAVRTPAAEDGSAQAFEYLIEARDGGTTVLRFVHSGFLGDDWDDEFESMTGQGWDMYLHTLAQYLRHFPGRTATYIEAEAPQASSEESAWPVLLRGLELSPSVTEGDRVRLHPDGLDAVDGVVDCVMPNFVGFRTSDALYRFHGRAPLGMTIAVGHHLYGDDVDRERAERGWQAWLDGVFA
jgi:uncharacterized protein YndB with AHSA1/START domain